MRRPPLTALIVLLLSSPLAAPTCASAQSQAYPQDSFNAHRFYLAPGPHNFMLVDGADVGPDLLPTFGATLGYSHRPFVVDDLDCNTMRVTGAQCANPMNQETDFLGPLLTLQAWGAFTFLERIQLGLNLPIVLYGSGEEYQYFEGVGMNRTPRRPAVGGDFAGLSDPRVSLKLRILDPDHDGNGVMLAAAAWVSLPLGYYVNPQRFTGDRLPNAGAHFIGGFRFDGFRLALNLGFAFREEQSVILSQIGFEAIWGLAAAYRFAEFFEIQAEVTGWTSFGQHFDDEAPTDIRGAFAVYLGEWSFNVGGGAGLVYGVGAPVFQVFGGFAFAPALDRDSDGDSINDSVDGCPDDAEDVDEWEDEDGCPDLDNDGDEVPDGDDPCPNDAEDLDEHEDQDGCPEEDNDGDGIRDGYDSCPDTPEDMDGDRDNDGCPDNDTDGDGIDDPADQCPNEAEDFDGLADADGCPEEDADGDGVPDTDDECPEQAEDRDGFRDNDGCPEEETGGRRHQQGR
ncbi:MAG: thrombospondin type 3 repeat-containing protein [Sandaracinaceae bacterium]